MRRVAIVGMGHELRGDDGAGIAVARELQAALGSQEHLLVLDTGPAPESFTGVLRRFGPELVVFVDAAQMGEEPGTIRCLAWGDTEGGCAGTHTPSPAVLAGFLGAELGCGTALIGVQPEHDGIAPELSRRVAEAVDGLVVSLVRALSSDWVPRPTAATEFKGRSA
jgi:hydrogenase 3 maturation protease